MINKKFKTISLQKMKNFGEETDKSIKKIKDTLRLHQLLHSNGIRILEMVNRI